MKKILAVICLFVFASASYAGLELSNSGGGSLALPAGTTTVTLDVDWVNDTGGTVTFLGAQVLNFSLSPSFYGGSGLFAPTLAASTPNVTTTPFVDLGITSPTTPLGTLAANNFVGFSVLAGESIKLGELEVNIPADFLGEFILQQADNNIMEVSLGPAGDLIPQGTTPAGTTTVGTGTVVPEPSSFLFLGLVGTAALGLRRFGRRDLLIDEEEDV